MISILQHDISFTIDDACPISCIGYVIDGRSCGYLEKLAAIVICMISRDFDDSMQYSLTFPMVFFANMSVLLRFP